MLSFDCAAMFPIPAELSLECGEIVGKLSIVTAMRGDSRASWEMSRQFVYKTAGQSGKEKFPESKVLIEDVVVVRSLLKHNRESWIPIELTISASSAITVAFMCFETWCT